MKIWIILVLTVIFFNSNLTGQTRNIIGRVISEDLEPLPMLDIRDSDSLLLGKTDMHGRFKISIPQETDSLMFRYLGFEWTDIKLKKDCDTVEVVMMYVRTYDFMTLKKVDRLREKEFDNLSNIHSDAVKNGFFESNNICYEREFEKYNPPRPVRDSINKVYKLKLKQIKITFNRLALGDTIRIPYYGTLNHDGIGKTTLYPYSFTFDAKKIDCIIQGVITEKSKHKGGYNLVYRVINHKECHFDSIILNDKELKDGQLIEYDMRYTKVLEYN